MSNVKIYPKNIHGRDFFTTDIHGHFDLLHEQMEDHAFNTKTDRLFVGGDSCDRGPQSDWILDYILEPWFISVRANHEQMVIDYIESLVTDCSDHSKDCERMLYMNGGEWFFDLSLPKQMAIYESFKSLPLGIELTSASGKKVGIVHAQCPFSDWDTFKEMSSEGAEATALWARSKYEYPERFDDIVQGVDLLLTGHTPTKTGDVEKIGNQWYCDGGSFFRNKLNFIEIE